MSRIVPTLLVGEPFVDLRAEAPSLLEASSFTARPGGAPSVIARAAARHGAAVELAGGAGDDAWGAWLVDRLTADGVGLAWFRLVGGERTTVVFKAGTASDAYGGLPPSAVAAVRRRLPEAVEACEGAVFTSGTLAEPASRDATLEAHEQALRLGRPVVVHPAIRRGLWPSTGAAASAARGLVDGAFLVVCDRGEAFALTGETEPARACAGLRAGGARHVVVAGAGGAVLRGEGGLRADVPAGAVRDVAALCGVLVGVLATSGFYPAALAAALPEAVGAER